MNSQPNPRLGRREFLAATAGILTAAVICSASPVEPASSSLRAAAAKNGLLYGAALRRPITEDPQFAALVAEQCSIIVPEWCLKWDTLRPMPDQFDFSAADNYLQFAQTNNINFRGHTLVWHEALPPWFNTTVNATNARKFLLDHISQVVGRYSGKMHSWDVVNEVVELRDFQSGGLRDTPWFRALGPEYLELAFHAAREADPSALLVYNEDQLEPETFSADAKRRCVLSLLKNLKRKNVPVQALGLESHISADPNSTVAGPGFKRFLQEVSDLGLLVLITEMDVTDQTLPADIARRDTLVADRYYRYLSTLLEFEPVTAVLTWGLSDRYTWLVQHNPRPDGQPVRPLPFGADLQPTRARDAIHHAFSEAPCRSAKVREVNQFPPVSGSVSQRAQK